MKTYRKIVLAGGTGQIGKALCAFYKDKAESIIVLTRSAARTNGNIKYVNWDGEHTDDWVNEIEGVQVLINLTGKNVNCRYTEENKQEIFDSRTHSIEALAKAVSVLSSPPEIWIQTASATIYRHAEDRPMTESNGEIGEGFSVDVCKRWEGCFWECTQPFPDMRKVVLRIGLVVSKEDGVLPRLKNLVFAGLGGKQGNGKQWVSWVHEKDVVNTIEWMLQHPQLQGVFNCTSPEPLINRDFMRITRQAYHIPFGLPSPVWLLKMGAIVIGTETELILKSRWVLPDKLLQSGFTFEYPGLTKAVEHIIH